MDNDSMTTFERRQRIISMLEDKASVRVSTLAELFNVSETTIRNDLSILEEENKLHRVHGGAVSLKQIGSPTANGISTQFANAEVKKRIAHFAADMVEDGDSILLDASTTVLSMTPYLQKYHNLTVVTSGLDIARALSENPSNTVVLIGGVLNSKGTAVTSLMGAQMLENLHFHTAFISCVGLSAEAGLTERNLEEARLKQQMLATARQVIALVDSSKLGQISLAPFAAISDIAYLVTDGDADPAIIRSIQQKGVSVTVCGENTVTSYRDPLARTMYRIGFANLSETESQFAVDVRRGLERAAQNAHNIDLIVYDNRLDPQHALRVADRLVEDGIDLAIEYQIDYKTGSILMEKFKHHNIPVIAVDIPIVGATFFGVDNYRAGHIAGVALGEWIIDQWDGIIERLLVLTEPRAGSLPETRIHGQLAGLQEVIGPLDEDRIIYLDSGNTRAISEAEVVRTLEQLEQYSRIGILSFNDDAALGALQAAQRLDREKHVVIVGQGADRFVRNEIRRPNSRIIGSTTFFPEGYGEKLLNLALRMLRDEPVPPALYMEHVFINHENINFYYPD
ncbi:MAG: DeoR/GlpR family transcriptional regulator [Anaerolineae bacterium]|nr:DeoR/GlpR family transcriptional regulator [Anaerolineae bacterium]